MSFGPSLVRSRFSAGLPSCVPQHRLRFGHWFRQRPGSPRSARYIGNDASSASVVSSVGPGVGDSDLKSSAIPRSTLLGNKSAATSYASNTSDPVAENRISHPPVSPAQPSSQEHGGGPKKPHRKGFKTRVTYNTMTVSDGELSYRTRFVDQSTRDLDNEIMSRTWFDSGLDVRRWRAALTEIFKAKHFARDARRELPEQFKPIDEDAKLRDLLETDGQGRFREAWEGLDKKSKAGHWKRMSLWLLQDSPELALEFFLVTSQSAHRPVFLMMADCLSFLRAFYDDRLKQWERGAHTYDSALQTCLDPSNWPIIVVSQKGVRQYLMVADRDRLHAAYDHVIDKHVYVTAETYLCFMRRFTDFEDVDKALDVLERIRRLSQHEFLIDSAAVMHHCCKLLTLDSVVDDPNGRNFRILPSLLQMGVRPDRDMMNVVLRNAFRTGDPQLGLDMLNFMRNQNMKPDSYTYLTLLTDAVSRGDRHLVDALIEEIEPQEEMSKNPWIANKTFHAHFVFTAKNIEEDADPSATFYSLLNLYTKFHDITPLKELTILPPEYTPPPGGANEPPSVIALYLIIASYLRCHKRLPHVLRIYKYFHSMVLKGHEIIAPLAATDHTYNEFLVAFRKDPQGIRPSVRLVEDMLQATTAHNDGILPMTRAKPTVRTWTLLLSSFTYNRQPMAAERVKDMMAKYGVEFNMVTWNTIISGYANAQNVPEVAKAIKAMEAQGLSIDAYTMKSLRYLHDPEQLWEVVKELDELSAGPATDVPSVAAPLHDDGEYLSGADDLLDQGLRRLQESQATKL
ncbi:pentatricopeptide repeat protein [Aspergillus candidus]|uniref:Pentatricopeptide repeat protein n=1 Tax=Aspergillus candidus TaxID=41067 RepID=A0A2I2F5G3_ASPCN|nr:pentatricopeptide repeat protein [Aspergillus candidus]PLB35892.1 pentatricopeptide repeat protein [Aspergillus candidus]